MVNLSIDTRAAMVFDKKTTLHQRLRRATGDLHKQAEAAFDIERAVSSLPAYAETLATLRDFHQAVVIGLVGLGSVGARLDLQRVWQRLAWLEEDLQRVETPRSAAPAVPFSLASLGEGLGSLYVVEGSALGGQVIFQKAADALRVSAERGGRYFHGHGHHTAAVWADFLRVLNAVPPWSAAGDQAEVGARRTFELFAAVMRTRHLAAR